MLFFIGLAVGVVLSAAVAVWFHRRAIRGKIKTESDVVENRYKKILADQKAKLRERL